VTEKGALYTRGNALGLGHTDGQAKQVPTLVAPHLLQDERVGRCHDLLPMHALAFAMSTYAQLGSAAPTVAAGGRARGGRSGSKAKRQLLLTRDKDCVYVTMQGKLVQRVVEACVSWPEWRAGELEGLVRMLGGGMMKSRGST